MNKDKIKSWWTSFKARLASVVGPGYLCYICNRELENPEYPICKNCIKDMVKIDGHVCNKCGEPILEMNEICDTCKTTERAFDVAKACYSYNEASRKVVADLKYNKRKYVVPFMAKEMLYKLEDFGVMPDIIVPVPITEKRYKERGFNQAELLADELATLLGNAELVDTSIVKRIVDRPPQANLSKAERLTNLKGVFELSRRVKLKDKIVLIIDDVFTTGTTVGEVSSLIKKLKPKAILVLTFAKTTRN